MKSAGLFFFIYLSGEIVFNEIMYDPDPAIGLPEYEFLELFNRSNAEINIENWSLEIGNRVIEIPKHSMKPDEYLLLVYPGTSAKYPDAANILEIMVSRTLLLNQGEILYLSDQEGNLIDWIEYSPAMHSDPYYRNGGWSLERIDPDRFCGGTENWSTSNSRSGGTPGLENSVFDKNPDFIKPELTNIYLTDSVTLILVFSESMLPGILSRESSYSIESGQLNPVKIEVLSPHNRQVVLTLDRAVEPGREYSLELTGQITDCSGLGIEGGYKYRFALPASPAGSNLLISEILFDPFPGCPEFIEIYNNSGNILDLADIRIAKRDARTGRIVNPQVVVAQHLLVFPDDYVVLSRDPLILQQYYHTGDLSGFIQVPSLPSLDNRSGNILILDKWLNIIDEFDYSYDMHFPLLVNHTGVSLERLSYTGPTSDPSNWHSASSTAGFATPGRENSQFARTVPVESEIQIDPEVFSPDQDGKSDICFIHYHFKQPGNVISIQIFDPRGRTVKIIAANELAGMEGIFSWDGSDMLGRRARTGIYLIIIEVFDLQGRSRRYKKTCVLSPGK
jgi:hypothetical protein